MSIATSSTTRRLVVAVALAGALIGAAAPAGAAPGDSHRGRDSTGADHIDPRGIHHDPDDPISSADMQENRRAYYAQLNDHRSDRTGNGPGNGAATWSRSDGEDGNWVVCKPLARSC